MRKRREIGSRRVGERLAKNQVVLSKSVPISSTTITINGESESEKPVPNFECTSSKSSIEQQHGDISSRESSLRPNSLLSTPPSSVTSEPIADRKLLPQRNQQRRTVKSQKRR